VQPETRREQREEAERKTRGNKAEPDMRERERKGKGKHAAITDSRFRFIFFFFSQSLSLFLSYIREDRERQGERGEGKEEA